MHHALSFVTACVLLAALTVFSDGANAGTVVLKGTYSKDTVKTDCANAGGTFQEFNSGGYGCQGPGGNVYCNKSGGCVGNCEKCGRTSGIIGVVTGQRGTVGTAPTTGGSTTTGPTVPPKPTQGIINR